eukprot:6854081-Pyramimonas_sp.AAC.1
MSGAAWTQDKSPLQERAPLQHDMVSRLHFIQTSAADLRRRQFLMESQLIGGDRHGDLPPLSASNLKKDA